MEGRTLKLILETVGQIVNITRGLNINKEALEIHASNLTIARRRLDKYNEQHKNEEYMKTLSPPEQQNLYKNANAVYEIHNKLQKEIEYLDMNKHPYYISKAISALNRAYLTVEYIYLNLVGESGDLIVPHLKCIQPKTIDKATYKQLVYSIYIELDGFVNDIWQDQFPNPHPLFTIPYGYIAEAYMWFRKENERLKVEALPEIEKIEIPEETQPEIPASPEVKKKGD